LALNGLGGFGCFALGGISAFLAVVVGCDEGINCPPDWVLPALFATAAVAAASFVGAGGVLLFVSPADGARRRRALLGLLALAFLGISAYCALLVAYF
jgi:hypothetical protein